MSGSKVFVLLIILLALASSSTAPLIVRIAYLLGGALVVAIAWGLFSLRGLAVYRDVRGDRVQVGQELLERITVTNRSWLPRPWLELHDRSTLPGHERGWVVALGPRRVRSWTTRTVCSQRGEFALGPVTIVAADPFGFITRRRTVADRKRVLVLPATVPLPAFSVPSRELPGGVAQPRAGHQATPQIAGVREYAPGDPLSRIHWASTARHGRLITKEFDVDPTADIWLALDGEALAQRGEGLESTEEYGVTVVASLARHFGERGRAVGFATSGARPFFAQPDRGPRQLDRLLEHLAVQRADGVTPFADLLLHEAMHLSRHTTLVAVTPSLDAGWVGALQLLRQRGVRAVAVLIEPATFGDADGSLDQVSTLAAADVPTVLVKRGDDLAAALTLGRRG